MTTLTYNLDFTISHMDSLQFEIKAQSQQDALDLGFEMIHNQMEDFNGEYDIELNDISLANNYTPLTTISNELPSNAYNSLENHYAAVNTHPIPPPSTQPELPSISGYTRLVN